MLYRGMATKKTGWLALFCGAACARTILPSQPMQVLGDPPDGVRFSSPVGVSVPADARRITVPKWAKLDGVFGRYDPPPDTVDVAFEKDEYTLLLLGSRGEVYLWDRVKRETVYQSVNCRLDENIAASAPTQVRARSLVLGDGGRIAVGYSTGQYCILESLTGKRLSVATEPTPQPHWLLMLAHLSLDRLTTYSYEPEWSQATKLFTYGRPAVGGYLRNWDTVTGKLISEVHLGQGFAGAFSPDGSRLALQSDKLLLLDRQGHILWSRPYAAREIEFISNQKLLLLETNRVLTVAADDGSIIDQAVGEPLASTAPSDLNFQHVRVAEEGRSILVRRSYNRLGVWKTEGLVPIAERQYLGEYWVSSAAPVKRGTLFLWGTGIFDVDHFRIVDPPGGPIDCLAASADATRIVGCRNWNQKHYFELWDPAARVPRRLAREDTARVATPRDAAVFLITKYGENCIADWEHGATLQRIPHNQYFRPAAIGTDGQSLVVTVSPKQVRGLSLELRDVRTGKMLWQNTDQAVNGIGPEAQLSFSDDGARVLAVTVEQQVVQLSAKDGTFITKLTPEGQGTWRLLGDLGLWCDRSGKGVTAYDLSSDRRLWRTDEATSNVNLARRLDSQTWLAIDGAQIRRRSVESGADVTVPIDLAPSYDAPTHLAATRNAGWFVVGTRRGVVLRFKSDDVTQSGEPTSSASAGQ